ncbi:hypothetical protein [Streptomyces sp. NPDC058964]|uniref:hypothetical protein n=1 Tax=Streptomyces sp. NPDC058964 TaxID=3346681 RepID=UPI003681F41B
MLDRPVHRINGPARRSLRAPGKLHCHDAAVPIWHPNYGKAAHGEDEQGGAGDVDACDGVLRLLDSLGQGGNGQQHQAEHDGLQGEHPADGDAQGVVKRAFLLDGDGLDALCDISKTLSDPPDLSRTER